MLSPRSTPGSATAQTYRWSLYHQDNREGHFPLKVPLLHSICTVLDFCVFDKTLPYYSKYLYSILIMAAMLFPPTPVLLHRNTYISCSTSYIKSCTKCYTDIQKEVTPQPPPRAYCAENNVKVVVHITAETMCTTTFTKRGRPPLAAGGGTRYNLQRYAVARNTTASV